MSSTLNKVTTFSFLHTFFGDFLDALGLAVIFAIYKKQKNSNHSAFILLYIMLTYSIHRPRSDASFHCSTSFLFYIKLVSKSCNLTAILLERNVAHHQNLTSSCWSHTADHTRPFIKIRQLFWVTRQTDKHRVKHTLLGGGKTLTNKKKYKVKKVVSENSYTGGCTNDRFIQRISVTFTQ